MSDTLKVRRRFSGLVGGLLALAVLASPAVAAPEPKASDLTALRALEACDPSGPTSADSALANQLNGTLNAKMRGYMSAYRVSCARVIVNTVRDRGLDPRAAVIAVTTAIVESSIDNIAEELDHDSLGLFQQRGSWGSASQRLDPVWATNAFLNKMIAKYPNDSWKTAQVGAVCQAVQVSAYPERYQPQAADAQLIVNALLGAPANDGHRIQFGDLNGDGLDDLVQVRDDKQVVVFWNSGANPNYSWSNNRSVLTGIDNPSMIRVGDFNGDNLDDILQIRANGNLVVFFNTGANPNFNWSNNRLVLTAITDSAEVSVGDLNNDGLDDIVQTRPTGQVVVFWNSGANPNFSWSNNRAVLSAMAKDEVKVGDFNADGLDDILQTRTGGQVVAFWNSGANPNFSWSNNRAVLTAMNEKNRVKTGDLNGDGLDDLIQIRPNGQVVVFWNTNANPNFNWSNNRSVLTGIYL
ncbi:VCBS repeat-containing protein [Acrocarpospora sp. B8E8]|uniref:FG-GAP repeat domain-containing protein n=1 Tax=Acrocarpospora sp. B8E8 TaxID=3153572 RepID=UPI00325EE94C